LAFELDLLGDAHPVLGDIGSAPALLQGDVAAPRAQRDLHRVRKGIDPCEHLTTGLTTKSDVLAHGTSFLRPDDPGALARARGAKRPRSEPPTSPIREARAPPARRARKLGTPLGGSTV